MKINLKNVKTGIFGTQGSGKTFMTENFLIKNFKNPVVYLIHAEDFKSCDNKVTIHIPKKNGLTDTSAESFNEFCKTIILGVKDKTIKCDAIIIDEADLFFPKDFRALQKYPYIHDLIINHRHYGLAVVYISRRPQDITTNIVETSEHIFVFVLNGINAKDYFKNIHKEFYNLMDMLHKDEHNFIYQRIGERPKLCNKIKSVTDDKAESKRSKK